MIHQGSSSTASVAVAAFSVLAVTAATLVSHSARANVGQEFGFGSQSAALAGATGAWGFQGYAAAQNPAALAIREPDQRVQFTWGLIYMDSLLKPITGVTVENDFVSDKYRSGDVDTAYRPTFGQAIGARVHLFPELYNLSFGVTTFLPILQLAYIDTGETFVPEYVMERSRTQRPQVEMAAAIETSPYLTLGAGLRIAYSLTSDATVFLQTADDTSSSMRFASSIKPKVAPYLGALYRSNPDGISRWSAGVVFRFPVAFNNVMNLASGARAFGQFAALDFHFQAVSAMFYDPMTFELSTSIQYADRARLYLKLDYERWSLFQAPALQVTNPTIDQCENDVPAECTGSAVEIQPSSNPQLRLQDILVPRIGHEFSLNDRHVLRLGYSYRHSIFQAPPHDAGNYLNPSEHILTAGVGLKFNSIMGIQKPFTLDLHAGTHYLVPQTITKSAGDEAGDPSDVKIGSPGYTAGGWIFGGGLSASFAL